MNIRVLFGVFILIICSVGITSSTYFEYSTSWVSHPYITNGLGARDYYPTPTVFYEDGILKMICGDHDGICYGYVWNGSNWAENSSIVSGLPDTGYYSSPHVYDDDGTLKMVLAGISGWLNGYNRSGGSWVSDASVINGIYPSSGALHGTVYNDVGTLKLITRGAGITSCDGYYRNSTQWVYDSDIAAGLEAAGSYGGVDVFDDSGTFICLIGNLGYRLYSDVWIYDSSITNGLLPYGDSDAVPSVYENDGTLYTLMGYGTIQGYYLYIIGAPAAFDINGIVYDSVNCTPLDNVSVKLTQSGTDHEDTSDANGIYNTSAYVIEYSVTSNLTKMNYTHEEWSFIPYVGETHYINQYMIPTNVTFNGSGAVHGIVTYDPYYQALYNATVTIANATWNNSTTTNTCGYYWFENLTISNYNISASAAGYSTSDNVTVSVNGTTLQNVNLEPKLTLTVIAKNADTLNLITDYSVILEGITYNSVNGSLQIGNLNYGVKDLILTADGYYATEKVVYMDTDATVTILATQILGAGTQYAPHYVKFTVKSLWGTLYSGVDTVVYLGDTASGELTLNGTTGTDGAVGFMLVENLQYTLTFIDASQSIDESITLYPIENSYPVYIYDTLAPDDEDIESEEVTVSISTAEINDTHAYINVTYTDAMNETTDLNIYINQSDESDPFNQTVITFANLGATSSVTHSFIINDYPGQAYFINVDATHTTFGDIQRTYSVRFDGMLEDYGFSKIWVWIGVGGMMFVAGMFKASKAEQGALVVCVVGWVFMGMGFFDSLGSQAVTSMAAGLGLATVLAIGANMSKKDRDETV